MRRYTGIAAFSDLRTPSADGVRDAITTRPSASANFFVDSEDRVEFPTSSSTNFTINKNQSLFNGFFNRIAVAEVVLNWGVPNVAEYWGNNTISITNATTAFTATYTIPDNSYRVVDLIKLIVSELNLVLAGAGDPLVLSEGYTTGGLVIESIGVGVDPFIINQTTLADQIFFPVQINTAGATEYYITAPLVLGTKYIDIVCQQLTYNQELKDNTTSPYNRDVLYRWYFTYDNVPVAYDYIVAEIAPSNNAALPPQQATYAQVLTDIPIIEGYTAFVSRRTPPVVKQIRWSPEQPIGQVTFQVYDDQGRLLDLSPTAFPDGARMDFQMSLLLSED